MLKSYDFNSLSLRLPGVVGPGAHDIFLSKTLAKIKAGEPIKAHHPDALFNNVVHILDLTYFLQSWLISAVEGHQTANLGSSEPITIREVISLLGGEATYSESEKTPFLISIERAVYLGFQPATVRDSIKSYAVDLT
jgi:nucleoside-diphosphate-sugar epimerase